MKEIYFGDYHAHKFLLGFTTSRLASVHAYKCKYWKKWSEFSIFLSLTSLPGSDLSEHIFWSEYRVNRTRFHSLSSEFSLYMELESSEIHSSTSEISSLHRWSELFTRFLESI